LAGGECAGLRVQEAIMRHLTAAVICFAILYAVDSMFFDGWYFAVANQMIERVRAMNW
jgi:hypothetical protein